jgi:hypothetical protein
MLQARNLDDQCRRNDFVVLGTHFNLGSGVIQEMQRLGASFLFRTEVNTLNSSELRYFKSVTSNFIVVVARQKRIKKVVSLPRDRLLPFHSSKVIKGLCMESEDTKNAVMTTYVGSCDNTLSNETTDTVRLLEFLLPGKTVDERRLEREDVENSRAEL